MSDLNDVLNEIEDYLEGRADADEVVGSVGPHPNEEMSLLMKLQAARAQSGQGGESLARRFHEIYERLAPTFGYQTRDDTKQFDPKSANGRLMVAVCKEILSQPQPAQQVSVPKGWSLTHIDDPATDGYLVKGPGISYCAWKDKEPWLYLFCEALATTPQTEADGWIKCSERLPTKADSDALGFVWTFNEFLGITALERHAFTEPPFYTHWKPTGLKRPQPPQEGEGDEH